MIIGLTGPTGSGKSTVAKFFEGMDFAILDYDKISRDTTLKGSPCLSELSKEFGNEILDSEGNLQRKVLGKIVFSDSEKLERLIKKYSGKHMVLDAPLLFEAELDKKCDLIIGVIAPMNVRLTRICKRDSIDKSTAMARIRNQHDEDFFRENCDFIIENTKDTEYVTEQIKEIFNDKKFKQKSDC